MTKVCITKKDLLNMFEVYSRPIAHKSALAAIANLPDTITLDAKPDDPDYDLSDTRPTVGARLGPLGCMPGGSHFVWQYDAIAEAGYLQLRKKGEVAKTTELRPNIHLDLDKEGNVLGVEILDIPEEPTTQTKIEELQTNYRDTDGVNWPPSNLQIAEKLNEVIRAWNEK